jgi:acetyl-CoA carboxylase/biotin carboxylase 1
LKELSDSRYTVYDVLPAFFNHQDPIVTLGMCASLQCYFYKLTGPLQAAFEVCTRRAYRAYTLLSIDYEEGDGVDDGEYGELPSVVTWRFNLGQSHSPPSTPRLTFGLVPSFLMRQYFSDRKYCLSENRRQGSVSDLTYMINRHQSQPVRTGAIASFANLAALSRGFHKVAAMLPEFDADEYRQRYGNNDQPPNVINIALRVFNSADDMPDEAWFEKINAFIAGQR